MFGEDLTGDDDWGIVEGVNPEDQGLLFVLVALVLVFGILDAGD